MTYIDWRQKREALLALPREMKALVKNVDAELRAAGEAYERFFVVRHVTEYAKTEVPIPENAETVGRVARGIKADAGLEMFVFGNGLVIPLNFTPPDVSDGVGSYVGQLRDVIALSGNPANARYLEILDALDKLPLYKTVLVPSTKLVGTGAAPGAVVSALEAAIAQMDTLIATVSE